MTSPTDILRKVGWLSTTPKAFQDAVLSRGDIVKLIDGQPLYRAGDPAGGIFGILEGQSEIHLPDDGSGATLAHLCGPGHWHGDLAAFGGGSRRFTVVARGACRLLRLPRPDIVQICASGPENWQSFAALSAANLGLAISIADMLRRKTSLARVAAELLLLAEASLDPDTALVRASQSDIAALTGLSRAAVNAALGKLETRGWVRSRYGAVEIVSRAALDAFVHEDAG